MSDFEDEYTDLQDHLNETFPPKSLEDFLGKEHFWATGERSGMMTSKMAGLLFDRLVYPVKDEKPVDPSAIGLVVLSRREVGMPVASHRNRGLMTSGHNRKHYHRDALLPQDAVVQVRGLVLLQKRRDLETLIDGLTGKHRKNFAVFAKTLRKLVKES
jgi:hypothetical protein